MPDWVRRLAEPNKKPPEGYRNVQQISDALGKSRKRTSELLLAGVSRGELDRIRIGTTYYYGEKK